ncbi:hypothetical protein LTR56_024730 [Elasticomyces elasticus]|uniref:Carboxymuconolactone decarboxylase-like domain-containing protein n=1 Tax=Elasticomyces elasticus TaxID=574655 RepID=A0AAN7WBJ3_9PEZI|nr:hypothetical protein LTR56_024730 [Elasticomyces elasticus]KAK3618598.1 hypothetical protein LTR22_026323 [Elasticomyces elasticus]KAK4908942.1 hypothetical protein LTR49_022246 [Elasticomyces elasticus]KAK5700497.1 hypothetical protein LTR97_005014 [Elasticomyces elasticus]KAK5729250.1 hypothetical protein LTR15_002392 [Elasticomyces elasticus]
MSVNYSAEEIKNAHEILYNEGIKMRYKVAGKEYVDRALKAADNDYARPMQEYVSEACWGSIWTRPGLDLKTRSLLNLAMLCALNRGPELEVHTRGALTNGATEEEIREVILQAACYCGMPAGMEGFKRTANAIAEYKKAQETQGARASEHADVGIEQRMAE